MDKLRDANDTSSTDGPITKWIKHVAAVVAALTALLVALAGLVEGIKSIYATVPNFQRHTDEAKIAPHDADVTISSPPPQKKIVRPIEKRRKVSSAESVIPKHAEQAENRKSCKNSTRFYALRRGSFVPIYNFTKLKPGDELHVIVIRNSEPEGAKFALFKGSNTSDLFINNNSFSHTYLVNLPPASVSDCSLTIDGVAEHAFESHFVLTNELDSGRYNIGYTADDNTDDRNQVGWTAIDIDFER